MEVVAQGNSCSVRVCRGKGEAFLKQVFYVLNNPWCEEFSNLREPEEKSGRFRDCKIGSFQRHNLNIESFHTLENYFLGREKFVCFVFLMRSS